MSCRNHQCMQMNRDKIVLPGVSLHHIVFRSHGGTDDPGNTILLCHNCHEYAHGRGNLKVNGQRVTGRQFMIGVLGHLCETSERYREAFETLVMKELATEEGQRAFMEAIAAEENNKGIATGEVR